jgi:Xaa-Pro aminopeptidase
MNKEFFTRNRKNLVDRMEDNSVLIMFAGDAPFKSADEKYHFTPNRNFYYLTGIAQPNLILTIVKVNGEVSENVYVEREDPVLAKWIGTAITQAEASEVSGIEGTTYLDKFEGDISSIMVRQGVKKVYLDFDRMDFNIKATQAESFAKELGEKYPYLQFLNINPEVAELRLIKSPEEIEMMRRALKITKDGIYLLLKNMKPGMKENEIEAYFNFEIKRQGASDFAFHTIAASGKNATVLHYNNNNAETKDGDLILFDLGAAYNYYSSDISRTFPLNGKFTERQRAVYSAVLRAMKEVEKAAKPGVSLLELNDIAKKYLAEGCRELGLIQEDSELSKYYYHGVAHYLGLDTHDVGGYEVSGKKRPLEPGMVITNEPGLYIEEWGIGVRIEDDLLITEEGNINLSMDIIKEIDEIEEFMKNR